MQAKKRKDPGNTAVQAKKRKVFHLPISLSVICIPAALGDQFEFPPSSSVSGSLSC